MRDPAGQDWQAIFDRMVRDTPLLVPLPDSPEPEPVHGPSPVPPARTTRDGGSFVVQQSARARELEVRLSGSLARADQLVASLAVRHDELQAWLERERRRLTESLAAERLEHAAALEAQVTEARSRDERRMQEFEREAAVLLDRYETAARSAEATLDRADARLAAFDVGLQQLLRTAAEEIRSAAESVRRSRRPEPEPVPVEAAEAERAPDDTAADVDRPSRAGLLARRLATAAAVALIVLFGVLVLRQAWAAESRAAAAEAAAVEARAAAEGSAAASADQSSRAAGDALALAAKADRMLEILAAPDARRLDLAGRQGAPAAAGQALWSRSRGVIISAVRVPPTAAGEVYQVWLNMSSGPVSLGFAAPDALGRIGTAFELPPAIAGTVAGFQISREPTGGSSRPQGQPILSN